MLRALLAIVACLCLSGCWVSDKRFFGSDDWAILDIDGIYTVPDDDEEKPPVEVKLTTRSDGLVELRRLALPESDIAVFGLVPIKDGSGEYFLMVDRSAAPEVGRPDEGDLYYLVEYAAGSFEIYAPNCVGTPPIRGMRLGEGLSGQSCVFETEAALMEAALIAERFLSTPQIVQIEPGMRLLRKDEHEAPAPDEFEDAAE